MKLPVSAVTGLVAEHLKTAGPVPEMRLPMDTDRLRREICFAAAQLLNSRRESSFTHAKWRAARSITRSYVKPEAVPTDYEIRQSLQQLVAAEAFPVVLVDSVRTPREQFLLSLLLPLDRVRQPRVAHPEGDVLFHSLQVFELARQARPWDEDFLLAALLHDVGKGIDPADSVAAGLAVLGEHISERTRWLIENLEVAQRITDGTIGVRARRRLTLSEDSDTIDLLAECDREGRLPGRPVCTPEDALAFISRLSSDNEGEDLFPEPGDNPDQNRNDQDQT